MSRKPTQKPSTIYDVADRAGVSHITVSRVVNDKQNVSAETREKVLKAMAELEYTPNLFAQTLQTRKTSVIELITTDIWGSNAMALTAIGVMTRSNGYQLSVLPINFAELENTLATIPNRMVAGSLLYSQDVELDYAQVKELTKNHPFVHMGGKLHSKLPSVTYDQYYAAHLVVEHLIESGHQKIAFISGPISLIDGTIRLKAYTETLTRYGLKSGPIAYGNFGAESGAIAMNQILDSGEEFSAVFAANDEMAAAAIHVLNQRGFHVPNDISVAGFNNDSFSQFLLPPLTTVTNNFYALGDMSIQYLFEQIKNPQMRHNQRIITPELVVRESTRAIGKSL
jgi:DNA-binding LacI/PurR family transcriptional regulator